jgi:hypothetical protein
VGKGNTTPPKDREPIFIKYRDGILSVTGSVATFDYVQYFTDAGFN